MSEEVKEHPELLCAPVSVTAQISQEQAEEMLTAQSNISTVHYSAITTAGEISAILKEIPVSLGTYSEIKMLLKQEGHEFGDAIDMGRFALVLAVDANPETVDIFINSQAFSVPYAEGLISYDEIRNLAYPLSEFPKYPSCTWNVKGSGRSGILNPGKKIMLERGLIFNIMDTSNA